MNLLFLEQHPRFGGGSERITFSLCEHAVRRGHTAALVYETNGDLVDAYRGLGVACEQMPVRPLAARRPVDAIGTVRHLRRVARRHESEIVFTSQVNYASAMAAVAGVTRVATAIHLGLVYDYPSPLFWKSVPRIGVGIAPSGHTADGWRARGWPESTLRVIPNGIDTIRFQPADGRLAARDRLGLGQVKGPIVTYVGRLTRVKGVFTLAKAFADYRRRAGAGHLLFVGAAEGDDAVELEREAVAVLGREQFEIRKATPAAEDVYRAADLVVVPSEWDEPFGLVPIEALATGTMTIVSDRGIMPSFVSAATERAVFHAGDVADLAGRLATWLGQAALRESTAATLSKATRSTFAFDRCGDAYLDAFSGLIAS